MSDSMSGYAVFKPRARLLKLIGEELISDEVVAVTELVKNSHDADATCVTITFRAVTGQDGEIIISDDGTGMDREIFLGGWMEPAGSTKVGDGEHISKRGRRVLGEKGVGRFAADKLGRTLQLISRRAGHSAEVRARFDWDLFDSDEQMLSNIKNRWEILPASEIEKQGTILRIGGLRQTWTEGMFRRLSTRLSRLQSPFGSRHGFVIRIETDEFPDYAGELPSSFIRKAPHTIELSFDGADTLKVEIAGKRQTVPAPVEAGPLSCGPVRVRLYAFDLETEAIARVGPRNEVRAWLKEWSGVSVYRDGFRIWPYGEPHDDWLRLDQRRVNNPAVCLSNNQVVGFVEISRDRNPDLADQTNREGLVNNQALQDLRTIVEHTFEMLEEERQKLRRPGAGTRGRRTRLDAPVSGALDRLVTLATGKSRAVAVRVAQEAREAVAQHEVLLGRTLQGFTDLAAAGQAAVSVSGILGALIDQLHADLKSGSSAKELKVSHDRAIATARHIEEHLAMLAQLNAPGSHKRRTMDVLAELESFRAMMAPLLGDRHVGMAVTSEGDGLVRVDMHPHSFRRVAHILLSNSMDWLIRTEAPRISIHVNTSEDSCIVTFSDNGKGIPKELADRVFEPMFTTKEGALGMGLTIARRLVEQNGGTMAVLLDGRRRGAHIRIVLPRKRSRATIHD
jgi:signal transduction histidine kinase